MLGIFLLIALAFTGCRTDPERAKRAMLEKGNKYFAQSKFKEARLAYQNALKADQRFGEAWFKLADTHLRLGNIRETVGAYRRAVELLPNNPEPAGKLADLYLTAYASAKRKDQRLLTEVADLADTLLKRDPRSFHGLRLKGLIATSSGQWKPALEYLRRASEVTPNHPGVTLATIQVLSADGQPQEAERTALDSIERMKEFTAGYDFLIATYLRQNRLADAEAIIKRKIANNPKSSEFQLQLAALYYGTQRRDEAVKVLDGLLGRSAEFANARMQVADFYGRVREWQTAIKLYQEGAEKDPKRKSEYLTRVVMARLAENKPVEAMAMVDQILKEDPKNNEAIHMRAGLLLQTGNKDQIQAAINDLQTLLSRMPQNPVVRYNLARAYHARGELDAARVQYQEAVKLRPDFVASHIGLAQIYLYKADYGKVLQATQEVLKIDPANVPAKVLGSNALLAGGNLKQARLELETALKTAPESGDLQYQLALVNLNDGRFKEAEDSFRKLRTQFPNDPRPLFGITQVALKTNRNAEAISLLTEELKKNPARTDVRLALANTALRTRNLDLAAAEFQKLIEANPRGFELYMQLGEIQRLNGDMAASLATLKKGQALAPQNPAANLQLALTLEASGDRGSARPLYESVLKAEPDNAYALNNLAYMMAEEGRDLDQALTYAQRAKQKLPGSIEISDTLGWVYIKKNLSDNAIQIFRDLVAQNPNRATFHYHLAMAFHQKGDKVKARQSLQKALELKPDKAEESRIRELLQKLG